MIGWLRANTGHIAAHEVLDRIIRGTETLEQLEQFGLTVVPEISEPELRAAAAYRVAGVLRTARRWESATDLYAIAHNSSGGRDLHALFAHAQLQLEMGRCEQAETESWTVVTHADDYELKRRAYAMVARVMQITGRSAEAAAVLETLVALDDPDFVEADTLLLQSIVLDSIGNAHGSALAIANLERLLPGCVALRTLAGRQTRPAPTPAQLLLGGVATAAPATRPGPSITGVQVGSFANPENARDFANALESLGLPTEQRTIVRNGRELLQVVVPIADGSEESAMDVLATLQAAGHEGHVVY